jgi:hypothetical protein
MKVNMMSMSSDNIPSSCSTNTSSLRNSMKKHFSAPMLMHFVKSKWKPKTKDELNIIIPCEKTIYETLN